MKIVLSHGLVGRGGDAIQVLQIAEALRNLGHDVKLLSPLPLRPYSFSGTEGRLRSLARRLPWWAKDLIELGLDWRVMRQAHSLRERSFDLIFHRAGIYDKVGVRLAELWGCPLIVWLDAPFPIERAFRGDGYFKNLHHRCMQKLGQQARLIVTVSQTSKEYYMQLGLPEEKIRIVPNGIPERLLQRGLELAREHRPFSRGHEHIIGFVGSLSRWHSVGLLLEALHQLRTSHGAIGIANFRVQIVGYGEEYAKLHAKAYQLGVASLIEWLGALPHEQSFEQIAQFDIAVLPHTLSTGAPMKLFEYAALARPTIAPDLPNLRDLFTNTEVCFVEPGNPKALAEAILWLAQHPEEAVELGQRAQTCVRRYSWEAVIKNLLASIT